MPKYKITAIALAFFLPALLLASPLILQSTGKAAKREKTSITRQKDGAPIMREMPPATDDEEMKLERYDKATAVDAPAPAATPAPTRTQAPAQTTPASTKPTPMPIPATVSSSKGLKKTKKSSLKLGVAKGGKPYGFKVRYDNSFYIGGDLHNGAGGVALGLSSSTFFGYEFGNGIGSYIGLHGAILGNYLNDEPNAKFKDISYTGFELGVLVGLNFSTKAMSFMPYIGAGAAMQNMTVSYNMPKILGGVTVKKVSSGLKAQTAIYYGLRMEAINTKRTRFVFGLEGSYQTSPIIKDIYGKDVDMLGSGLVKVGLNIGVAFVTL